jgi:hypothetical protein
MSLNAVQPHDHGTQPHGERIIGDLLERALRLVAQGAN